MPNNVHITNYKIISILFVTGYFSYFIYSEGAAVDEQEGDLHPAKPGDGGLELRLGVRVLQVFFSCRFFFLNIISLSG